MTRSERAKAAYSSANKPEQDRARRMQHVVARAVGGEVAPLTAPFDVIAGPTAIEVKTLIKQPRAAAGRHSATNGDKITMHREAIERKRAAAWKYRAVFTVVVDVRGPRTKYYVRYGVGSFRLSRMRRLRTLRELREVVG